MFAVTLGHSKKYKKKIYKKKFKNTKKKKKKIKNIVILLYYIFNSKLKCCAIRRKSLNQKQTKIFKSIDTRSPPPKIQ